MINYLFPEGRSLCLTFSYDDGNRVDERLANLFSEYGLKGTFNLNARSISCGNAGKIQAEELKPLFLDHGHEVACHGFEHPFEEKLPLQAVIEDIRLDRLALEAATGAPVRGFAYPFGTFSNDVKMILRAMGIAYARTVNNCRGGTTYMPGDFLEWDPTCHHNGDILDRAEPFLNTPAWYGTHMLYIWGHAFEFENGGNWHIIEEFCKKISGHGDTVWYATNIEIADYIHAYRNLCFSANLHQVYNPSVIPVWLKDREGRTLVAEPGKLVEFA